MSRLMEPWPVVCILIILLLMDADTEVDAEVDARTGVPMEEGAGARQTLQDAIMDKRGPTETMIMLFQYARHQSKPIANLLDVETTIFLSDTFQYNILLVLQFLVITDVNKNFLFWFVALIPQC